MLFLLFCSIILVERDEDKMIIFINSILLGSIFEIFFIWNMIIKIKEINNKKILLFMIVFLSYFISGIIVNFTYNNQYLCYIILNALIYLLSKIFFKNKFQIIDVFLIYYIIMTINFSCLILMKIFGYNLLFLYFNRILLILIIMFSNKIKNIYKKYIKYWNRKDGNKVKSITLRNLSIISMNVLLYIINWYVVNYLILIINR